MRCILIFFLSVLFVIKAQAYTGFSTIEWQKGAIILNSHDVVTGEVSYHPVHDVVLHRSAGKVQIFTASEINYFHLIHQQTGDVRRFVALPYNTHLSAVYKRDFFFELLLSGEVSFLRKTNQKRGFLYHAQKSEKISKVNIDKVCYDYFTLHNEQLTPVKNFKEDALPMMAKEYLQNVNNYIEAKNIRKFTPRDQLVVIYFYNTLRANTNPDLVQRMELSE